MGKRRKAMIAKAKKELAKKQKQIEERENRPGKPGQSNPQEHHWTMAPMFWVTLVICITSVPICFFTITDHAEDVKKWLHPEKHATLTNSMFGEMKQAALGNQSDSDIQKTLDAMSSGVNSLSHVLFLTTMISFFVYIGFVIYVLVRKRPVTLFGIIIMWLSLIVSIGSITLSICNIIFQPSL